MRHKRIVGPNEDLMASQMSMNKRNLTFGQLQYRLPSLAAACMEHTGSMKEQFERMYLLGPTDAFEEYQSLMDSKIGFMKLADTFMRELHTFEKEYLVWMSQILGEDVVKEKLAKAMKGLNNG